MGCETKMRSLQSQGGIIGDHMGRRMVGLAESSPDNSVICLRGVEAMLDQKMLLDAIDFNVYGCGVVVILHQQNWVSERTAGAHSDVFKTP